MKKYLKAMLQEVGVQLPPRTHDLSALLSMLLPFDAAWAALRAELAALTDAAVEFRYPNQWSSSSECQREAFATCSRIRKLARESLGLRP